MTRPIIVVDVETNGLDLNLHEAWEVAWHNLDTGASDHFFVALDLPRFLANAQLDALRINRFVDRYPKELAESRLVDRRQIVALHTQLRDNTLAGSNPTFDAAMLKRLFDPILHGGPAPAPWHHRLWDLSAYAAGVLGLDELPGLAKVCELLGVEEAPDHTAEADVAATVACFRQLQARVLLARAAAL